MATPSAHDKDTIVATSTSETDDAASTRVLHTPELLENIILNLSSADAISIRRVCKYWKSVTESTKQLRQHVFLEAAPFSTFFVWKAPAKREKTVPTIVENTTLEEILALESDDDESIDDELVDEFGFIDSDVEFDSDPSPVRQLHPVLRQMPQRGIGRNCSWIDFVLVAELKNIEGVGDWRTMFITQPPCRYSDICIIGTGDGHYLSLAHQKTPDEEVTLGGLLREVANYRNIVGAKGVPKAGKLGIRIPNSVLSDGDHARIARGETIKESAYLSGLGYGTQFCYEDGLPDATFGISWR